MNHVRFETLCASLGFKIEPKTDTTRIIIVRTDDFRILISFSRDAIDKADNEQLEALLLAAKQFGTAPVGAAGVPPVPSEESIKISNGKYVEEAHGWKVGDYAVVADQACHGGDYPKIMKWFGDGARRVNAIAYFQTGKRIENYALVFHTKSGYGDLRNFIKYDIVNGCPVESNYAAPDQLDKL